MAPEQTVGIAAVRMVFQAKQARSLRSPAICMLHAMLHSSGTQVSASCSATRESMLHSPRTRVLEDDWDEADYEAVENAQARDNESRGP